MTNHTCSICLLVYKDAPLKSSSTRFLFLLILCILVTACGGQTATTTTATATPSAKASSPSTSLSVTGLVKNAGSLTLSDLQTFSKVTVSIDAKPIGSHTFGGALLYDVLQKAQVTTLKDRKNDLLRKSLVISGTDGYTVAVAWGELDPHFANKQILLAYEEDGKPLPHADGFTRLIVPGEVFAGRYLSNVASIVGRDPGVLPTLRQRQPSSALYVVGTVNNPAKYDLAALQALKTTQVTVQGNTYSGVLLYDLLQEVGVQTANKKNDFLHKGIAVIGSDGYSCVLADGEIQPRFGNEQILIAFTLNGKPLAEGDGFARLVVPSDSKMGRFVSNLVEIQVVELAS